MNDGQRLTALDPVADFLLQHDADGKIDRRIFPVATGAERFAGQGDLERVGGGDDPRRAGWNGPLDRGGRQHARILGHSRIAILRPDELRKLA